MVGEDKYREGVDGHKKSRAAPFLDRLDRFLAGGCLLGLGFAASVPMLSEQLDRDFGRSARR